MQPPPRRSPRDLQCWHIEFTDAAPIRCPKIGTEVTGEDHTGMYCAAHEGDADEERI